MKKIKMLGASLLALSSLLLSSYTDGRANSTYSSNGYSLYSGKGSTVNSNANNGNSDYDVNGNGGSSSYSNGNKPSNFSGSNTPYYNNNNSNLRYSTTPTPKPADTSVYTKAPSQNGDFDMNLFEDQDEQDAYSEYGYTRGDIYYIYRYKFDPNQIVTVDGTVERVIRVQYPDGDCYLVLIISTSDGDLLVNLGPVFYFDSQRFVIDEGDSLTVKGSKIRLNGRFVVIATEVNRDGKVAQLRSESGQAVWKSGNGTRCNGNGNGNGKSNGNGQYAPRPLNGQTQYQNHYRSTRY